MEQDDIVRQAVEDLIGEYVINKSNGKILGYSPDAQNHYFDLSETQELAVCRFLRIYKIDLATKEIY